MGQTTVPMAADRLVRLGRALVEARRYAGPARAGLEAAWRGALAALPSEQRAAVAQEAERLTAVGAGPDSGLARAADVEQRGPVQELMHKCAGLELKLQTEAARYAELEAALRREQDNHKQAVESLSLQQRQIKELQQTRTRLTEDLQRVEGQLRLQINATEQAQLKYEKLKGSRRAVGDQVTEQTEQLNALKAENERLREQYETLLRKREQAAAAAQAAAADAKGRTAQTAFGRLWGRMHGEIPGVFLETHVPDEHTFERAGLALVELLRVFVTLEQHVHGLLRDLRRVGDADDKLNRFYIILTKNPGLAETLRDYLASGKREGNFTNLLRAVQAWARAFASGMYKAIVKSPTLIGQELNYRSWPMSRGRFETEEACIGRYFKETAQRGIPEKLGTEFRKQAGDEAYDDYNNLMRQR